MTYQQELSIVSLQKNLSLCLKPHEQLKFVEVCEELREIYYKVRHDKEVALRCFDKPEIIETIVDAEKEYQELFENILIDLYKKYPSVAIVITSLFFDRKVHISKLSKYFNAEAWCYLLNNPSYDMNEIVKKYSKEIIKYNIIGGYKLLKRVFDKERGLNKENKKYITSLITKKDTDRYKKTIVYHQKQRDKIKKIEDKIGNNYSDDDGIQECLDNIVPNNGLRRMLFHNKLMGLYSLEIDKLEAYTFYFLDEKEDRMIVEHLEKVENFEKEFSSKLTPEVQSLLEKTDMKLYDY